MVRNAVWGWNQSYQLRQLQQTLEYRIELQTKRLQDRLHSVEFLQNNNLRREEQVLEMKQELFQLRARRDLQVMLSSSQGGHPLSLSKVKELPALQLLLVDDSATIRATYQAILEEIGYQVVVAKSVEQALQLAFQHRPELALIDYHMPGGNGDQLIGRLRSDRRTERVLPLLFTSDGDELLASEAGAVHWINKDQSHNQFLQKMALVRDYLLKSYREHLAREGHVQKVLDQLAVGAGVEAQNAETKNRRILVVDDEETNLQAISLILEQDERIAVLDELDSVFDSMVEGEQLERTKGQYHFEVTATQQGQMAIHAALHGQRAGTPYAVALVDMRMPNGLDGLETARQLRMISPDIDVVIMSAYSDYSLEEVRGVLGENFSFMSKPFSPEDLLQRVVSGCAKWERERYSRVSQKALIGLAEDMDREIQRRKETEQELEQANRTKDEFLSSMSHELRTPLSTIIGYNEVLLDESLPAHQRGMLESSLLAGNTLLRLVNDILDMSKIRAGKFELSDQPFDVRKMLQDISQLMGVSADSRGVALQVDLDPAVEPYLSYCWIGDEMRVSQILFNLLSNAIKFSEPDQEVVLSVRLHPEPALEIPGITHFQLSVEDRGIGMAQDVVQRLFQPFEQAEQSTSRRYGGTGLGLFISRQLVQMMGGEIQVESVLGEGSRFTVYLPLKESEIESCAGQAAQLNQTIPKVRGRVLLAEDVEQLQQLGRLLIEKSGAVVDVANNGREAVEMARCSALRHEPYDLVLMDMQMPEVDGLEATRQLKAAGCKVPVVALTANVTEQHRQRFHEVGCDEFLSKPIQRTRLYSMLSHYLAAADGLVEGEYSSSEERVEREDDLSSLLNGEMMAEFWEYVLDSRILMEKAWSEQDWEGMRRAAHAIKGMGSSYGYPLLTELGAELETSIQSGDPLAMEEVYLQMLEQIEQSYQSYSAA